MIIIKSLIRKQMIRLEQRMKVQLKTQPDYKPELIHVDEDIRTSV